MSLFQTYGWTLDYQISAMKNKLNNINTLTGFNPNAYYFAYNNELSKDIGLNMSGYSNTADIDVEIYRIHESMPQEFYPVQDCRGIVVKNGDKIIGAFISAGRHNTFNACSLKGNSFDNLKSAKLLKAELIDEPDKYTKIFRVTVDLQYNNELTISSGEQYWDCHMVYESPQTGWKIEGFGH